ncbi:MULTISPECIES: HpcH/HpaI aldolase family protein [Streptomyces]|uniref:5-keto-4-deoxy-D-glucarate aldolase n=1 Tax=Streptomyces canarius TaxID=285453 RepID=A0ABQ3D2D7_9ACTN|nr:aldolase/citrate lyase family protein [Streptomyces canarius]GHA54271.1 5-keto-4-deoxy-D-glucarate aldolase [Streptomyces canarius]
MTTDPRGRLPRHDEWTGLLRPADERPALGIFLVTANSMLTELCGTLPLDWVVLDMEASPMTKRDALHMLQALNGSGCAPIIRVPFLDHHAIEHALDVGAAGVMVPKVDNARDAAVAASACRFPPEGSRGLNPVRASGYFEDVPGYVDSSNKTTVCMVQIESATAVGNAGEIAATAGVDVLFIGTGDLALSLGQPCVLTGPALDEARAAVLTAARTYGKRAGIFAYSLEAARQYIDEGFDIIAFGNEVKLLREALLGGLAVLRDARV